MASLPPRPSQRSSQSHQDSTSDPQAPETQASSAQNDPSQSTVTLDSQTVLINDPSSSTSSQQQPQPSEAQEPRKCWICFSDETEDTPTTSAWKSPCPCALTAHEACLLDWVADMEAPQNRNRQRRKIQCPQCKADIQVARPRSLLVSTVAAVDRMMGQLTLPGIVVILAGGVISGAWVHGLTSVYIIFGNRDFNRLNLKDGMSIRWLLGLPTIPAVLIASRTTLADTVLPLLPVVFFATQVPHARSRPSSIWPPSAALTFAALPWVRAIYNEAYKVAFAAKEKQWIQELRPHLTNDQDSDDEEHEHDHDHDHDDHDHEHGHIELDLQIIHGDADDNDEAPANGEVQHDEARRIWDEAVVRADADVQPPHRAAANAPDAENQGQGQGQQQQQQGGQDQQNRRNNVQGGNWLINPGRVLDAIMGALCFPVVAATTGELLRLALPRSLTAGLASSKYGKPGLLQSRWGRSVVGGCLFVVVKDALLLYSRYKLAKAQRERKIVDWRERKDKPTANVGRGTQTS